MKHGTGFTDVDCYADTVLSLGFRCVGHDGGGLKIVRLTASLDTVLSEQK